tara:strand:+ start:42 stop:677 length:636 start_codon:yes stop_codon:yes gene_type:complete
MIKKLTQEKGILTIVLEKSIEFFLRKECNYIGKVKINIVASSIQIIKGIIKTISIIAEEINYKGLLFDKVELVANDVKVIFNMKSKRLNFKNNFIIEFKISLSEDSLKKVLLSNNWNWIGNLISNEMLGQKKLNDINIKDDQILINTSKNRKNIKEGKKFDLKAKDGKLFLEDKIHNKSIKIPIEDKVCIKNVIIEDNLINISANSSIIFN